MDYHQDPEDMADALNRRRLDFLEEREKFLNTLDSIDKAIEERRVISHDLELIMQDVAATRAAVRSLKAKLNKASLKMGLQPIPKNGKNGNGRHNDPP